MNTNLLPKAREDFASKTYWDGFFKKRKDAFEWYGEYNDLCCVIHKYCKIDDDILMAGCGNSKLSEDMYDVGYRKIVNIDISDLVIKQMTGRNQKKRSAMKYMKMDVKQTIFGQDTFNVIIDKGTLDALYTENNNENAAEIEKMFNEFHKILKSGGRYICVTLAQGHIIEKLLSYFPENWFIRVHRIHISHEDDNNSGIGAKLPVFACIFTKINTKLLKPVLELCITENADVQKFQNTDDLKNSIQHLQGYAVIQDKLGRSSLDDEVITVDLWCDNVKSKEPRYSLTIIDTDPSKFDNCNGKYAIFIVPQGKELEATYSTKDGLKQLAEVAGFARLAVATLHRGHMYKDLEEIKGDLSEKVMELAPPGLSKVGQVPFLTASNDVGSRDIIFEGFSELNGEFLVEEVKTDEEYYCRQLLFRNDLNTIQSKVRLKIDKSSKKKAKLKKRIPDYRYLLNSYQKAILAGLSFLQHFSCNPPVFLENLNILVLGLRGGCFTSFLLNLFDKVNITCVEEDSAMIDATKSWFNLSVNDNRLKIINQNVEDYLTLQTGSDSYDIIISEFMLNDLHAKLLPLIKLLLKEPSVFVYRDFYEEQSCPNPTDELLKHFPSVYSAQTEDDFQMIYCISSGENDTVLSSKILKTSSLRNVNELKNYMYEKRAGFYEKTEWDVMIDYVDDLYELSS